MSCRIRRAIASQPRWVTYGFAALFALGTVYFFVRRNASNQPGVIIGADGRYYWAWLNTVFCDGDIDFANQYESKRVGNFYGYQRNATGRLPNGYNIGPAVMWSPAYLLARGVSTLIEPAQESSDGNSFLTQRITLYSSFLYALGALVLVYAAVKRRFGPGPAAAGAVAAVVCGPVVHYAINQPHYAHAPSAFAVTALLYVWDRRRGDYTVGSWIVLGFLAGLAMLVRTQNVVFALPLVADGVVHSVRAGLRCDLRAAALPVAGAVVAGITFVPQLLAWRALYGSWMVVSQGSAYMRWDASLWSETLFSSRNGLFPWAPAWAIAAIGLIAFMRRERWVGAVLVSTVVLVAYVNGAVWDWWGMGSFGGRRYDGLLLHVGLGMGTVVHSFLAFAERRPRVVGGLLCCAVGAGAVAHAVGSSYEFQRNITRAQPDHYDMRARLESGLTQAVRKLHGLGNPLSWPGAWALWFQTGIEPRYYDLVVGPYLLDGLSIRDQPGRPKQRGELRFSDPVHQKYLVRGFDLAQPAARVDKRGPREIAGETMRALVPLNVRGGVRARLAGQALTAGRIEIAWNGDRMAAVELVPGAIDVAVVPPVRRGINVLDVSLEPGTRVALSTLVLDSMPPAP